MAKTSAEYVREWRKRNPEKAQAAKKKWRENPENRAKEAAYNKKWAEENKEHRKEYNKAYRETKRDKKKHAAQERERQQLPEIKARREQRRKERMETDSLFAIGSRIRTLIRASLKVKGVRKNSKTEQILGCTISEFHQHLESLFTDGMNWDNRSEWEIDHIIPMASAKNEKEALKLNHFTNLQPLWANENRKKRDKILTN